MKIYLAPMEGVVDPVIRELFSFIGGYDQMCTEFIRVTENPLPAKTFYRYCPELKNNGKTKYGTPVFVQLLGGKPEPMAINAKIAMDLGAPGIDVNFGCPAKKVNSHDGGAALLQNPHRLFDILSAIKKQTNHQIPVTAKVRLGFNDKTFYKEIAHAVKQAGVDLFTVHARTKVEGYKPPAHWQFIKDMKDIVSPIKTVANGEIWTIEDYNNCVATSECTDVALGRGAFADPFLARKIKEGKLDITWDKFTNQLLPQCIKLSIEYKNTTYALARLKQWSRFLSRTYPEAEEFFQTIKHIKQLPVLDENYSLKSLFY